MPEETEVVRRRRCSQALNRIERVALHPPTSFVLTARGLSELCTNCAARWQLSLYPIPPGHAPLPPASPPCPAPRCQSPWTQWPW